MRCNELAFLLLSGWLLMTPPLEKEERTGKFSVKPDLPVSEWVHESSHDRALDCEKTKSARFNEWLETLGKAGAPNAMNEPLVLRYYLGRCVPAEHIYPPKKLQN